MHNKPIPSQYLIESCMDFNGRFNFFDKSFIFISFPYLERKYKYKNTFIASLLA